MTSTTDEITNLRYSLDHIRAWCAHEVKNGNLSPEASAICDTVRAMATLGLKTPRASRITLTDKNRAYFKKRLDSFGADREEG